METYAPTARFVAFTDNAPVELRDVEDLHDADLDAVLADRLADGGYAPVRSVTALARLVVDPGRAALLAHDLSSRAARLAQS
ncbi:MAG: hypothetical protein AVDCRST_MAG57-43 [uncultured Blastococcus sp.]|uniref:Uncharacterized protein n=1 Tax=uncultured Blastococcus sp. TaxID=217144 RepID=A0A6J4GZD5_9ACTN|nr:MAG: hypothetical protein AVDCRST_MAG57-43 [uncultured Blastococcus sp.]